MNAKHGILLVGIGLLLVCIFVGTASAKVIMIFEIDNSQVDTTPPVLHDIWVTPIEVNSGECVTVYVNASDDLSGVDMVFPMFLSPSEGQHLQFGGCDYNSSSGLWEKDVTIPLYAENGTWIVDLVDLRDNAENYERYEYGTDYFANFTVNSLTPENQPPVADFMYSPEYPVVNQTVTFNASASHDPDGNITNYEWDFGDKSNATGIIVTHSYSANGTCNVNLTVTDDEGATNSTTKEITVQPAPDTTPPSSISNLTNTRSQTWINWTWTNPPDADFNYTMVYLNGTWQTNTSNPFCNATNLTPNTVYEIATHTVDEAGNINQSWINQSTKTELYKGDVDRDGSITAEDAVMALEMAVGSIPPNNEADVNCDGRVTSLDALMILQMFA